MKTKKLKDWWKKNWYWFILGKGVQTAIVVLLLANCTKDKQDNLELDIKQDSAELTRYPLYVSNALLCFYDSVNDR